MTLPTPEWLNAQYNNRARVPEHAQIFRWALASGLARERSLCHVDVSYGPDASEKLDVFTTPATVGGDESAEFLRQNRLIRTAWGADAVPVCEAVAGANHLSVLHGLADPAARLHALALDLLGLPPAAR